MWRLVLMLSVLDPVLKHIITSGTLHVTHSTGQKHSYGDGKGTPVAFRLTDKLSEVRLAAYPEFYLGENYMNGTLVMEEGTIADLLALLISNLETTHSPAVVKWPYEIRR